MRGAGGVSSERTRLGSCTTRGRQELQVGRPACQALPPQRHHHRRSGWGRTGDTGPDGVGVGQQRRARQGAAADAGREEQRRLQPGAGDLEGSSGRVDLRGAAGRCDQPQRCGSRGCTCRGLTANADVTASRCTAPNAAGGNTAGSPALSFSTKLVTAGAVGSVTCSQTQGPGVALVSVCTLVQ